MSQSLGVRCKYKPVSQKGRDSNVNDEIHPFSFWLEGSPPMIHVYMLMFGE